MSDSVRKQIIDAVIDALGNSTGIETVTDQLGNWWEYQSHRFPVVTVLDRDTELGRLSFESTGNDRMANMDVLVRGYVFDRNNETSKKRTDLIKDVQTTMEAGTTTLNELIHLVSDVSIETDDGVMDNYSIFDINYSIEYYYNHATP